MSGEVGHGRKRVTLRSEPKDSSGKERTQYIVANSQHAASFRPPTPTPHCEMRVTRARCSSARAFGTDANNQDNDG